MNDEGKSKGEPSNHDGVEALFVMIKASPSEPIIAFKPVSTKFAAASKPTTVEPIARPKSSSVEEAAISFDAILANANPSKKMGN